MAENLEQDTQVDGAGAGAEDEKQLEAALTELSAEEQASGGTVAKALGAFGNVVKGKLTEMMAKFGSGKDNEDEDEEDEPDEPDDDEPDDEVDDKEDEKPKKCAKTVRKSLADAFVEGFADDEGSFEEIGGEYLVDNRIIVKSLLDATDTRLRAVEKTAKRGSAEVLAVVSELKAQQVSQAAQFDEFSKSFGPLIEGLQKLGMIPQGALRNPLVKKSALDAGGGNGVIFEGMSGEQMVAASEKAFRKGLIDAAGKRVIEMGVQTGNPHYAAKYISALKQATAE